MTTHDLPEGPRALDAAPRRQWLDDDLRAVIRLALPAIGNSLLQTAVFLADRVLLGHHSESALAAMQAAGPIIWSVYSVFGVFTVGTIAVVGRAIGARDANAARDAARGSLLLALTIGVAVGVIASVLLDPALRWFGRDAGPDVMAAARGYLRIGLPAMPLFFVGLTCISVLQAAGNTRTPLLIGLVTNAVNIAANWVLVFGHFGAPRLGATGSACGSAIAASCECALGLWVLTRADSPVPLRSNAAGASRKGARRVLRVAWAAFGERLLYHIGYLAFVSFVVQLGRRAMAANQALISIESISFLTADGCAVAAAALVAQRLGEGNSARARGAGWRAAGFCAALLGMSALLFVSFPAPLVRAFRDDAGILALAVPVLRIAAIAQIPMAIGVVLGQSIRAAGATREALLVSFVGALAVRIGATWWFVSVMHFGLVGIWLGSTSDWIVRALVYVWRWQRGRWAEARV